jgi:TnpA family transposase
MSSKCGLNKQPDGNNLRSCIRKVIAANVSEAAHILDGLLHHECALEIREHYTDTAGAIDHVFGLCHLLGFRLAPRIRDLADRRPHIADGRAVAPSKISDTGASGLNLAVAAITGTPFISVAL